jgi:PIN domain nuclease of toxin-antitoxin system
MSLVLDTCALLAFARADSMRGEVVAQIDTALDNRSAYVPAVVALEIAQKCFRGSFQLLADASARAWYERTLQRFPWREIPMSASIVLAAYELPEPFHKDPADRLIVATARLLDCPVVTVDERILAYGQGHLQTLALLRQPEKFVETAGGVASNYYCL